MFPENIRIGENTIITNRIQILSHYLDTSKPIHTFITGKVCIVSNFLIGVGALIVKPFNIGDGAVIAAGAIVTKDVHVNAIVVGSPGKIIGYRIKETKVNNYGDL